MIRAVLLVGLLLCGRAAAADEWWASVLGPYQGPVLSGDGLQQLDTEFSLDAGGRLVGRYHVEDGRPYDGQLTDFHADGPTAGSFTWHDRYGQGVVHVAFDPGHGRFLGFWGWDSPEPGMIFNGYRILPPPTS